MTQQTELARVKARIRALADRTVSNGCTEAEAMSAATMVGRLLERYALAMDEIDVRAQPCVQVLVPTRARRGPIDACVPAIARFCDCRVWLAAAPAVAAPALAAPQAHYVFFGFDADAALAAYLFAVIARALASELARFRRTPDPTRPAAPPGPAASRRPPAGLALRRACASFQHGMVARIADRLARLHHERQASVDTQRPAGTALAVVKHAVVDDAFRDMRLHLVTRRRTVRRPLDSAYRDGWSAGAAVSLDRPLARARHPALPAAAPHPAPRQPHR